MNIIYKIKYKLKKWHFEHFADDFTKYDLKSLKSKYESELDQEQNKLNKLKTQCKPDIPKESSFGEGDCRRDNLCPCCKKRADCEICKSLIAAVKDYEQAERKLRTCRENFIINEYHLFRMY